MKINDTLTLHIWPYCQIDQLRRIWAKGGYEQPLKTKSLCGSRTEWFIRYAIDNFFNCRKTNIKAVLNMNLSKHCCTTVEQTYGN